MARKDRRERELDPQAQRLRDWARSKPAKREKTTPEQMRARMDARAAKRAARPRKGAAAVIKAAVGAAAVAGTVALAVGLNAATASFDAANAANQLRIAQLEGELADASKPAATQIDPSEAGAVIDDATEAASQVASLQNTYSGQAITTSPTGELLGAQEYKATNEALRALFTDGARTGGALDPATQWYAMWDQAEDGSWHLSPADAYEWTSARSLELTGPDTARVAWELREASTGKLLAWATGTYDGRQGGITAVSLGTTTYGDSRVAPSDSGVDGTHEQHQATEDGDKAQEGES